MTVPRASALLVLAGIACAPPATKQGRPNQPAPVQLANATAAEVDSLWHRADSLYRTGHWSGAQTVFERLNLEFGPGDARVARARFELAECYLATGNQLQAVREFRRVSDDLPSDELAPQALLRAGDAYAELWRKPELDPTYAQTAIQTYHELQSRYAGTSAARMATTRVAGLEDLLAYKQYRAALFYVKYKAYDSAIIYLKDIAATYPRATITPTALLQLIGVYHVLGYQEDVNDTCGYLRRTAPTTEGVAAACAAPAVPAPVPPASGR